MVQKHDIIENTPNINDMEIVSWSKKYATGIELIDNQHRELVKLTNELYRACLTRDHHMETVFKEAMGRMVNYVRFHFGAEIALLERVKYPEYPEHKKQHEELVQEIIDAVKDYEGGKKLAPNSFVRTLKDWVFGHIAVYDKNYSIYVEEQKKKGLLTDQQINQQPHSEGPEHVPLVDNH